MVPADASCTLWILPATPSTPLINRTQAAPTSRTGAFVLNCRAPDSGSSAGRHRPISFREHARWDQGPRRRRHRTKFDSCVRDGEKQNQNRKKPANVRVGGPRNVKPQRCKFPQRQAQYRSEIEAFSASRRAQRLSQPPPWSPLTACPRTSCRVLPRVSGGRAACGRANVAAKPLLNIGRQVVDLVSRSTNPRSPAAQPSGKAGWYAESTESLP